MLLLPVALAQTAVHYVRQTSGAIASSIITDIQSANDGSGRLFIVEQRGLVHILRGVDPTSSDSATVNAVPFLDLSSKVRTGVERGLLGLAFHPNYADNGVFFINYSDRSNGDTVIHRCRAINENTGEVDPRSDVGSCPESGVLKVIYQPSSAHNGGQLAFGPDGYLYSGMGDGGRAQNSPDGSAQVLSNCNNSGDGEGINCYLGKFLRVDVDDFEAPTWSIPPDNPCVIDNACFGNKTDESTPMEIWSIGHRNPFRFSFGE